MDKLRYSTSNLKGLMPRSHQHLRLVPTVKLLEFLLRNRRWPTTFYTVAVGDAENDARSGRCEKMASPPTKWHWVLENKIGNPPRETMLEHAFPCKAGSYFITALWKAREKKKLSTTRAHGICRMQYHDNSRNLTDFKRPIVFRPWTTNHLIQH